MGLLEIKFTVSFAGDGDGESKYLEAQFGLETTQGTVRNIIRAETDAPVWEIEDENGRYKAMSVIIATGARARKLGVPGETDLLGKGVKKSIDNLLDGEKPNLEAEKRTFEACKEKYGELSPKEMLEKLKDCK